MSWSGFKSPKTVAARGSYPARIAVPGDALWSR